MILITKVNKQFCYTRNNVLPGKNIEPVFFQVYRNNLLQELVKFEHKIFTRSQKNCGRIVIVSIF